MVRFDAMDGFTISLSHSLVSNMFILSEIQRKESA
jgi:hypothetical protein